jgi:hypothetical protein
MYLPGTICPKAAEADKQAADSRRTSVFKRFAPQLSELNDPNKVECFAQT